MRWKQHTSDANTASMMKIMQSKADADLHTENVHYDIDQLTEEET